MFPQKLFPQNGFRSSIQRAYKVTAPLHSGTRPILLPGTRAIDPPPQTPGPMGPPPPAAAAKPKAAPQPSKGRPAENPPSPSLFQPLRYDACVEPTGEGLLACQSVWFLSDVDVSVRGELLSGVPISMHGNTVRVINDEYSYYIPLHKIDYIRTADGLRSSFDDA